MWREPSHIRGAALTGLVCIVWIFLARRNPDLHYHFAPLIASSLWPLSLRTQGRRSIQDAAIGGVGAVALTWGTTLLIQLAGYMDGPNFLHAGPAWPEAVLFTVIGAAIGVRTASRARLGILGNIIDTTSH